MPRISLRTYEKDIEEMIERNQLNEAVAHCKHILQFFPKNISTYRILGKSFLEEKQYKDTADIFTRVLAVYPDDFIAHAGMSIVQELENDLDAAIWHMQMAFDSQPSNIAIQEELKRLFDRRDGTHPEKIRLTRGALVRMYARGELYQQAIDEIKSALSEEPKRIDLQVFLAKMYFLSGDQEESMAIAERLISDFPYCYELNRILVSILKNLGSGKKAEIYSARLVELNPYQAYVNDIYASEDQVPDEKVVIDRLTDVSSMAFSVPANWSEPETQWKPPAPIQEPSVPLEIPGTAELKFEPEMDVFTEQPQTVTEITQKEETEMSAPNTPFTDPAPVEDNSENNIPDWMRNSGWLPSNGKEAPTSENEEITPSASQADPADMPDWLKSLSQEDVISESPENPSPEKSDEVAPSPFAETAAWMNNVIAENIPAKESNESDLPDWLKNFETDDKAEPVTKDDLPDWLNALKSEDGTAKPAVNPFETEPQPVNPVSDEVSSPIKEGEEEVDPLNNLFAAEASSWQPAEDLIINKVPSEKPEDEPQVSSSVAEAPIAENLDILSETQTIEPNVTISQETENDLLDWLRDLKPNENEDIAIQATESVPEESLDNEERGYDFAAQLDRLQNIDAEPAASVTQNETPSIEAETPETPSESEIPSSFDQGESNPAEPVSFGSESDSPSQPETTSVDVETADVTPQEKIENPTLEPVVDVNEIKETEEPTLEHPQPDLETLRQEAEENPDDFHSWQNLGDAYAKAGNLVEALTAFNKAESILINSK